MIGSSNSFQQAMQSLVLELEQIDQETALDPRSNPEDQLKLPVSQFLTRAAESLQTSIRTITEHRQTAADPVQGVRIDMAIKRTSGQLIGHLELKSAQKGANPYGKRGWTKHDKEQWEKLKYHPNLIYTNGSEWTLLRHGFTSPYAHVVLLPDTTGQIPREQRNALKDLIKHFLAWQPTTPSTPRSLAQTLAPLSAFLRDSVASVIGDSNRDALDSLYERWTEDLMPGATPSAFADSFAQTFTYALLLARVDSQASVDEFSAATISPTLRRTGHRLIGSVLELMSQESYRSLVEDPVAILETTIGAVNPVKFASDHDPWLYFYEDFLAAYDPAMRKDAGVYYTPVEVVKCQVRLIDHILQTRLGKERGLGDSDVSVLDPALGTATYLLSVIQHVINRSATPRDDARSLANRLYGFELLMGPYAVAHLRLTQALESNDTEITGNNVQVYLTNTLSDAGNPSAEQTNQLPLWEIEADLNEEARLAGLVKTEHTRIRVILGNPPYDRGSRSKSIGENSIRRNIILEPSEEHPALLDDFINPLKQAGAGSQAKNLYNSYIYFIRWAIWKACEQNRNDAGVVSFITSSSYLRGPGFAGVREYMRRSFDEIWIIDLGGEGRGARREENIFSIQTPVAIFFGVQHERTASGTIKRHSDRRRQKARVFYRKVAGSRSEKLATLSAMEAPGTPDDWETVDSDSWQSTFTPTSTGELSGGIPLNWVFPWAQSGVQYKRKWPIAPSTEALDARWKALFSTGSADPTLFREDRDLTIESQKISLIESNSLPALSSTNGEGSKLRPTRYGYRSFDRQWCFPDPRLGTYMRQQLWATSSKQQIYFASLTTTPLGEGPALTATPYVPDLHFFRGSFGARDIYPLYRDSEALDPNVSAPLLAKLTQAYERPVSPAEVASYTMGLLGTSAYTSVFAEDLAESEAHVPFTTDAGLFERVSEFGEGLLFEQSWGERFGGLNEFGQPMRRRFTGTAKLVRPTTPNPYPAQWAYDENTQTLSVEDGTFENVKPSIMAFNVSGLSVVRSWLGYRMKRPAGRLSSPLDGIHADRWHHDRELLELLWQIEYFLVAEERAEELLREVLRSELLSPTELGPPPAAASKAPPREISAKLDL